MRQLGTILTWLIAGLIAFAMLSGIIVNLNDHESYQGVNNDRPGSGAIYSGTKTYHPVDTVTVSCTECGNAFRVLHPRGMPYEGFVCVDCRY